MSEDFHAFFYRVHAGSLQCFGALYFNNAHTAAADLVDILEEAEGRDRDVRFLGSLQDGVCIRHI